MNRMNTAAQTQSNDDASRSGVYPAPRKPALARCSPERYAAHVGIAEWFAQWCADHRVSLRDLAEILGVTVPVARTKLNGDSPVTLVDLYKFPTRYRSDLLFAFSTLCGSDSLRAHG